MNPKTEKVGMERNRGIPERDRYFLQTRSELSSFFLQPYFILSWSLLTGGESRKERTGHNRVPIFPDSLPLSGSV